MSGLSLNNKPTKGADANKATASKKHLTHTEQWRCMNCGQHVFVVVGSNPPDICQYCNDMTTWKPTER